MRLGGGSRVLACYGVVSVVSLVLAGAVLASPVSAQTPGAAGQVSVKKKHKRAAAKPLTKAQVIALIKRYAGQGPKGSQGPAGPSTGPASGALAGSYPNPTLNVSGGPCANGQALTNVSSLAVLTCVPGVYSDANNNVAAGPNPFGGLTTGGGNSALGRNALNANRSGSGNTAVGQNAGASLGTGSGNLLFGQNAGVNYVAGESSNIDIGSRGTSGESNTIHIGTDGSGAGQQNKVFLAGMLNAISGPQVLVDTTTGQLGVGAPSSRRFKTAIQPLGSALNGLMALRPVSFRYKPQYANSAKTLQYGLIAEDVAKVYPNLVAYGRDGKPYAVEYQQLPALLLAKVQQQQHQISALQAQNRQLRHQQAQIDWLMHHARLR